MREDIQKAIKEYEIATNLFFKKNVEAAEKYLDDSENVILCLDTNFCINYPDPTKKIALPGIIFLTHQRIIIYYKWKDEVVDVMPIEEITDIKPLDLRLEGDHIQVYSADKIYDFLILTKQKGLVVSVAQSKQAAFGKIYRAFWFAKNPNGFGEPDAVGTEKKPVQSSDIPDKIEKLSALKDKGIISEEEFQSKKTELLSRL